MHRIVIDAENEFKPGKLNSRFHSLKCGNHIALNQLKAIESVHYKNQNLQVLKTHSLQFVCLGWAFIYTE